MKVAFVHPNWPGSEGTGATYSATKTVTELEKRGHQVCVYCPERPPDEDDTIDALEYRFIDTDGFPYHPSFQINRTLRSHSSEFEEFDIVHSYQMRAIPALCDIGREHDVATVVTLNAYFGVCAKNDLLYKNEDHCTSSSTLKCARCILTAARKQDHSSAKHALVLYGNLRSILAGKSRLRYLDACRAPTEHVRRNYSDHGFPSGRMHVIPHILDESFVINHESTFEPPYRLLYIGYLEPWKGVTNLVPLVEQLRTHNLEVTLTVVGEGSCTDEMKSQVRQYGLEKWVRFLGRIPNSDLPEVYATHDVFVYPGVWEEPLGRVYLEALASGTPVLSTEYGSINDVIGQGGETAQPDPTSLATRFEEMVESGLEIYSIEAVKQADQFRAEKVISDIEELYRTALRRKEHRVNNDAN